MRDLGRVWPLSALDLAFQVLPPTLGVAFVLGFGPELTDHIVGRLPVAIGAGSIVPAVATLLVVIAPLTLVEEIVYRVVIQDGLSRSLGTPAAILVASLVFALAHAVGTTGSSQIVLCDVAGVALDGILFGIIYARTHNLAVTWATHYVVDVLGLLALLAIF
jgi:membrane protease YdiL (CAAX protease family)